MPLRNLSCRAVSIDTVLGNRQPCPPQRFRHGLLVAIDIGQLHAAFALGGLQHDVFEVVLTVAHERVHHCVAAADRRKLLGNWYWVVAHQLRKFVEGYRLHRVQPKNAHRLRGIELVVACVRHTQDARRVRRDSRVGLEAMLLALCL